MTRMFYQLPMALVGGSYVMCPFEQRHRVKGAVTVTRCGWRRRLSGRRVLGRYRRHWYRKHAGFAPWAEPDADVIGDVRRWHGGSHHG